MHKDRVLYFLLLKHLQMLRGRDTHERVAEVARTLKVVRADYGFSVSWQCDGGPHTYDISHQDINFYPRGDFPEAKGSDGEEAKNTNTGRKFALHALQLEDDDVSACHRHTPKTSRTWLLNHERLATGISGLLLLFVFPVNWQIPGILIGSSIRTLFRPWSFVIPYIPAIPAGANGYAWSVVLFGVAALIAEFFDSDPRIRPLRLALAIGAIATGGVSLNAMATEAPGLAVAGGVLVIALLAARIVTARNTTPMSYSVPMLTPGLLLDGFPIALAILPLLISVFALVSEVISLATRSVQTSAPIERHQS